ncbi:MAG: GNAT family N-acetyltransferase [Spirochaetes bacterium]|nr:GNAT family N-acetyltransferase [Spirochaetota bacterium]
MKPEINDLYRLNKSHITKAGIILGDAFKHDPVWNKVLENVPDPDRKRRLLFETPLRFGLKYGQVYAASPEMEGVAVIVPGELADMTFPRLIKSGAIISAIKLGSDAGRKMKPVGSTLTPDRNENMKGRPYVYLFAIGVAEEFQGKGFGKKMLHALIDSCSRAGLYLYLETETENNVELYKHFGFQLIKKVTIPKIELPMWELFRSPDNSY